MKSALIFFTTSIFLLSCNMNKTYEEYYFIPTDYNGWVNIIYDDSLSNNQIIQTGKAYFHLITGNPLEYRVNSKIFQEGFYTSHFYYYGKDTLNEIFDETHLNMQVFRKGTSKFASSRTGYLSAKDAVTYVSFYVSNKAVTSVSDVKIPENPISDILRGEAKQN